LRFTLKVKVGVNIHAKKVCRGRTGIAVLSRALGAR
jgi:hypothetical protein